jgi:hydroxymethylpyrimidine pyrophosphatase-like HAD family hydrolase
VSAASARAVRAARDAGMAVTICTGRGLAECLFACEAIEQRQPVIVAGGSMISDPVSRRTLHRFPIHVDLVRDAVDFIHRHGHAALVLKDPLEAGYDYLVVRGRERDHGRFEVDPVTRWWFQTMSIRVREVDHMDDDEHPEHTVRVGVCGFSDLMAPIKRDLETTFADRALVHHFPAVIGPQHTGLVTAARTVDILELFDRDASKWRGVRKLAQMLGVDVSRVVAIGDHINDLDMLQNAALGVAMGNAVPEAKAVAKRQTASNAEDGVAEAISRMLSGEW